jgi:uncharacterized protein YyaL (SSP411 family)
MLQPDGSRLSMANRLAASSSLYLRQHAGNPVDWHPWGSEALERARAENKPILLSIGYSACHWCHVMAHESFEDAAVAALMNDKFVNIKVDREERPDLDQIYQTAHALLTRRSGGWPLTVFLTPDGAPFFAGTYYPRHPRHGLPGFTDILSRVANAYRTQGEAIATQNEQLRDAMQSLEPAPGEDALPLQAPAAARAALAQSFDPAHGGFGGAPKFPHVPELSLCLRGFTAHRDATALRIVRTTLERMADGGIDDQLGGGFFRYSVDGQWSIPHFEKMLYDNAMLLALYADAARATGEARLSEVARSIAAFLGRVLRAPDGTWYASLDADSEGEEGRYYVWQRDEVQSLLPDAQWQVAAPHYGLDGPPNFEGRARHLRVARPLERVAADAGLAVPVAQARVAEARKALLRARDQRVPPARDGKIITAWNALAIAGMARAARSLDDSRLADQAFAALDALVAVAWRDGRLHATREGDGPGQPGYLDDHAFLLAALIEVFALRFREADWQLALALAGALLGQFEDPERGGFWFTAHGHERLFHRTKPGHDAATPSGNGVAARALVALFDLTGELRYREAAERTVRLFAPALADAPTGFATLLEALEDLEAPATLVILRGAVREAREWQRVLERTAHPALRIVNAAGVESVPAALDKGAIPAQGAAAFVCRGTVCLPAARSLHEIKQALQGPL